MTLLINGESYNYTYMKNSSVINSDPVRSQGH